MMASFIGLRLTPEIILKTSKSISNFYRTSDKSWVDTKEAQYKKENAYLENWLQKTIVKCGTRSKESIDKFKLSKVGENNFYDPMILSLKKCIVNAWVPFPKDQNYRGMKLFWKDQAILAAGKFGVVLTPKEKNLSDMFVIKNSRYNNKYTEYDNIHEMMIILILNNYRTIIPNFSYGFGFFRCSQSHDIGFDEKSICDVDGDRVNIVMERIKGKTFYSSIKSGLSLDQILNYYLQVLLALNTTKSIDFSHNDLHTNNVMLRPIKNSTLKYRINKRDIYLKTNVVATIIDYGMSYLHLGPEIYSPSDGLERSGVYPDQSNRLMDAYKLFMFILSDLLEENESDIKTSEDTLDREIRDILDEVEVEIEDTLDREIRDILEDNNMDEVKDEVKDDPMDINSISGTKNSIIFKSLEPIFYFFYDEKVDMKKAVRNSGIYPLPKLNTMYDHSILISYISRNYPEVKSFVSRENPGNVLLCSPNGNMKCIDNILPLLKRQTYTPLELFYLVRMGSITYKTLKEFNEHYKKTNAFNNSILREKTLIKQLNLILVEIIKRYELSDLTNNLKDNKENIIEVGKFSNMYSSLLILRDINVYNYFYLRDLSSNNVVLNVLIANTRSILKLRNAIRKTSIRMRIRASDYEFTDKKEAISNYKKSSLILEKLLTISILTSWDLEYTMVRTNIIY